VKLTPPLPPSRNNILVAFVISFLVSYWFLHPNILSLFSSFGIMTAFMLDSLFFGSMLCSLVSSGSDITSKKVRLYLFRGYGIPICAGIQLSLYAIALAVASKVSIAKSTETEASSFSPLLVLLVSFVTILISPTLAYIRARYLVGDPVFKNKQVDNSGEK
jgi:hypothetical protein